MLAVNCFQICISITEQVLHSTTQPNGYPKHRYPTTRLLPSIRHRVRSPSQRALFPFNIRTQSPWYTTVRVELPSLMSARRRGIWSNAAGTAGDSTSLETSVFLVARNAEMPSQGPRRPGRWHQRRRQRRRGRAGLWFLLLSKIMPSLFGI